MRAILLMCVTGALAVPTAACGQAASSPPPSSKAAAQRGPRTLHLKPGTYTYHLGRQVRVGDRIRCISASGGPAGGGGVGRRGQGTGSSTGFNVQTAMDGTVKVVCPAHPSPM
jgi:hypothetical protein